MANQTIVAVYDTPAHAELAVQDMLQAGVPDDAVERHAQEGTYSGNSLALTSRPVETRGFWTSLFGGEPDHDVALYDRSVQNGSTVVSVKVPDVHVARVTEILESHAPVDMDDRARSYGLSGAALPPRSALMAGAVALSGETLSTRRRVTDRGTARIRRFVADTSVQQHIGLDEDRGIDLGAVSAGRQTPADFSDRMIEMTESAEQVVVAKIARVREEVIIRREVADRIETVRDTVRREDVEIIRLPGDEVASTAAGPVAQRAPGIRLT